MILIKSSGELYLCPVGELHHLLHHRAVLPLSTSIEGGFVVDVEVVFFAFAAFSHNVNMLLHLHYKNTIKK